MKRSIYMDHAATTPVHSQALEAMMPFFGEHFGNPSGVYCKSRQAYEALVGARVSVADNLGCDPEEVIFTSGGTESDNAALRGAAYAMRDKGSHIITSAIEHHAVLRTCEYLEKNGFEVTYLPVDRYGVVAVDDLEKAITESTVLVSIMLANNEIGTVQSIAELSQVVKAKARNRDIVFHTDAVQGAGALDIKVDNLGVDMLSLSAHKFYGPKGVGILYLRNMTPFIPQILGGGQEGNRRAGTENVAGIVGAATALRLAIDKMEENIRHCCNLRDRLIKGLMSQIPMIEINGHPTQRLPNNVNISLKYIEGEAVLINLDLQGVAASSGSACASGGESPSHVLLAIGVPPEMAHSSLRLTVGMGNTDEDVDYVLEILPGIVEKLRSISPLASMLREQRSIAE